MRITTSMVQRNVLADLNTLQSQLAKTQSKAASNKEITRPPDDPFKAAQAMGLRSSIGANEQYVRNIQDAQGWMDSTEALARPRSIAAARARSGIMLWRAVPPGMSNRLRTKTRISNAQKGRWPAA